MITVIAAEILSQRLEHAAEMYTQSADSLRTPVNGVPPAQDSEEERLARQMDRQAAESREWADVFRNAENIVYTDVGRIEVEHYADSGN